MAHLGHKEAPPLVVPLMPRCYIVPGAVESRWGVGPAVMVRRCRRAARCGAPASIDGRRWCRGLLGVGVGVNKRHRLGAPAVPRGPALSCLFIVFS
uniref:Uncharacterized protein n=1 Tax=Arundo donax TaxID=35708 RepID=A0A0A9HGL9_ARUDO